ncbi:hypothetical protein, partial [Proteus mirabilis]|uniref:hypothetical protein n=1 Tax=Proteus mirabilis TaxID=584 RepID=UPI0015C55EE5
QKVFENSGKDGLEIAIREHLDEERELPLEDEGKAFTTALELLPPKSRYEVAFIDLPIVTEKLLPSIVQAPELEWKPLPEHLKYVYLGEKETLPVIIAKHLTQTQEEKLVEVLRIHKTAIGWTIAD